MNKGIEKTDTLTRDTFPKNDGWETAANGELVFRDERGKAVICHTTQLKRGKVWYFLIETRGIKRLFCKYYKSLEKTKREALKAMEIY